MKSLKIILEILMRGVVFNRLENNFAEISSMMTLKQSDGNVGNFKCSILLD
jgi:hypothetical protein